MSTQPLSTPPLRGHLTIDEAMPAAPFSEHHRRVVTAPIEVVWPACLTVTASEIRTLGPLMAIRGLPARLTRRARVDAFEPTALLDLFVAEGFVLLRRDDAPSDGTATVLFGAAGRFWSPSDNAPINFESADDFLSFDEPGFAATVALLSATDLGDGTTLVETETRVCGTDRASTRRFAPYWRIIRGPSGLIRRSWLAAIDRRARRSPSAPRAS